MVDGAVAGGQRLVEVTPHKRGPYGEGVAEGFQRAREEVLSFLENTNVRERGPFLFPLLYTSRTIWVSAPSLARTLRLPTILTGDRW